MLAIVQVCMLVGYANPVLADKNAGVLAVDDSAKTELPRNRIDFTALYLDTSRFDSATAVFAYKRDLNSNWSFSVQATYMDSNVSGAGGGGIGDSAISISHVPNFSVVNSPWLPSRAGTGISVLLPTGDAGERRGFDATIVTPFAGLVYPWRENILILPSFAYAHSFGTPVTGKDIRIGLLEVGFSFVGLNRFWLGVYPGVLHNFEDGKSYSNIRLAIGMEFTDRIGLSFDWSETEQIDFNFTPGTEAQFTNLWNINLHFQF